MKLLPYIAICRPDHWIKNVFVVPGILLYLFFYGWEAFRPDPLGVLFGVIGICLVTSANYVFNEILDAESDGFHPEKKSRPIPAGLVRIPSAFRLWAALSLLGMASGFLGGAALGATLAALWLAGVLYNLTPFRLKDRLYLDVISESINNPLRLLAGWFMVGQNVSFLPPPLSVIMAYWMFGAYLMAIKRYAEYRFIDNPEAAGCYRKSFRKYNTERLQESIVLYGAAFAFFSGIFIARYRIELVLAIPLVVFCQAYYFHLGFRRNSPVQRPEQLYRERKLMLLVGLTFLVCALCLLVDVPWLRAMFEPRVPDMFER